METTIVAKRIREIAKEGSGRVSDDFITALDKHVKSVIDKALERAADNGRTTLMRQDL